MKRFTLNTNSGKKTYCMNIKVNENFPKHPNPLKTLLSFCVNPVNPSFQ